MRRKNYPKRTRNNRSRIRRRTNRTYIISKKAEAILSSVLADILEESLEDARNLAVTAGKSRVTREEMEKSLKNLCLRLSTAANTRIDPWNTLEDTDDDNNEAGNSSKKGRINAVESHRDVTETTTAK
ncbi:uncharacterized protein LOC117603137 [Osmia lignaria lignaria]|uniref:uncharacterized protein LOC117603137 n=1 Tax=Osmia lignaria lignaria TaxID=1437193 RepID=UPI0014795C18|nr:uncharacterized protein LOC117603137 isoform X2 [Osmia lignaria]